MAIYFLNLKIVGRGNGSSAVSAAAYRSGERIRDERTGRTYDHTDRQDVLHKEIMVPQRFASADMSWAHDRGNLWNLAESTETRRNARVAREYLVGLPAELSSADRIRLAAGFSRELVERYNFAVDLSVHAPRNYPGSDPRNFHAHLLATTREVTPGGLGPKTSLEWSDTRRRQMELGPAVNELLHVRERWAVITNMALEQAHIAARIDHRTLAAQGIDREPGPHIPRVAYEMERQGYRSIVAERIRAEYQARVEARQQRSAQPAAPAARERDAEEQQRLDPRTLQERQKDDALAWKRYRDLDRQNARGAGDKDKQKEATSVDDKQSRKRDLGYSL